ncbi:MAG TPA: NAD-dependent epimerase/dehydratase family protein [Patescibacteria group bacterium]|nr:NAD-dependent epimerase/dehydratase family protein [Patescibacteria group bacterium]
MLKNYYRNKRVLITGSNGFIGKHLVKRLMKDGAKTYGISRSGKGRHTSQLDILNRSALSRFIREKKIEICFHLAGESLVESGQSKPHTTFRTNINGVLNILEEARIKNFEKIIIASTSHVYGKNNVPYYEGYTPRPSRPYETSKACNDLIALSYADTFNLPVVIPRFVNIYGPGDVNFNRIIPKTIRALLSDKCPTMWGGDSIREYLFIDDAIEAYLSVGRAKIDRISGNRIFNFGSGNRISVENLIQRLIVISKKDLTIKKIHEKRKSEISVQYVSWSKANKQLRWRPRIDIDTGLTMSMKWYSEYFKS